MDNEDDVVDGDKDPLGGFTMRESPKSRSTKVSTPRAADKKRFSIY
jgi:hypothetical protein